MRRYQVAYGVVGVLAIAGYYAMPADLRWAGYELIGTGDADDRPEDLLRQADVAMYAAKEGGHGLVRRFDPVAMRAILSV
jgi:predicted signal transduction protein with EAL and GGDEF domain